MIMHNTACYKPYNNGINKYDAVKEHCSHSDLIESKAADQTFPTRYVQSP